MTNEVVGQYLEGTCLNVTDLDRADAKLFKEQVNKPVLEHVLIVIMVQQFRLKDGLAKFGDRTTTAVTKELMQLHDMKMYVPVNPDEMTP